MIFHKFACAHWFAKCVDFRYELSCDYKDNITAITSIDYKLLFCEELVLWARGSRALTSFAVGNCCLL